MMHLPHDADHEQTQQFIQQFLFIALDWALHEDTLREILFGYDSWAFETLIKDRVSLEQPQEEIATALLESCIVYDTENLFFRAATVFSRCNDYNQRAEIVFVLREYLTDQHWIKLSPAFKENFRMILFHSVLNEESHGLAETVGALIVDLTTLRVDNCWVNDWPRKLLCLIESNICSAVYDRHIRVLNILSNWSEKSKLPLPVLETQEAHEYFQIQLIGCLLADSGVSLASLNAVMWYLPNFASDMTNKMHAAITAMLSKGLQRNNEEVLELALEIILKTAKRTPEVFTDPGLLNIMTDIASKLPLGEIKFKRSVRWPLGEIKFKRSVRWAAKFLLVLAKAGTLCRRAVLEQVNKLIQLFYHMLNEGSHHYATGFKGMTQIASVFGQDAIFLKVYDNHFPNWKCLGATLDVFRSIVEASTVDVTPSFDNLGQMMKLALCSTSDPSSNIKISTLKLISKLCLTEWRLNTTFKDEVRTTLNDLRNHEDP